MATNGSSVSVAPRNPGDPNIIEPMAGVPGGGVTLAQVLVNGNEAGGTDILGGSGNEVYVQAGAAGDGGGILNITQPVGIDGGWSKAIGGAAAAGGNGGPALIEGGAGDAGATLGANVTAYGGDSVNPGVVRVFTAGSDGLAGEALVSDGAAGVVWGATSLVEEFAATTLAHPVPTGRTLAIIEAVGAGGGGGSGRRGAAGVVRGGGAGAAGGGRSQIMIPVSSLAADIDINIGLGGAGAAGRTVNDTSGGAGLPGGDTWVGAAGGAIAGAYVVAGGGSGGGGGTNTVGGSGGSGGNAIVVGASGGTGNSGGAGTQSSGGSSGAAGSGGGGGGINAANTVGAAANGTVGGWAGGQGFQPNGAANVLGPTVFGGALGAVETDGSPGPAATAGRAGAGGGGGGAYNAVARAGDGGVGSAPGGGGGGGGASTNGTNSGAGGNGADGLVRITWL